MTIENLLVELRSFSKERNWDQFHSPKNLSMALAVEASELLEIYQWQNEEQSNVLHLDAKKREEISDELADIFIYLLRLSDKTQINLIEASFNKMKKNALKYPISESFGSAKKYNEE
jgi:dCTP diphosphatase